MSNSLLSKKLIHTAQGQKWFAQFDLIDQEAAIAVANNLTLVSHTEFERKLLKQIEEVVSGISGCIGFFAIRELKKNKTLEGFNGAVIPFYSQVTSDNGKSVNALASSADQGSEAKIAHIIRQFCKSNPKKYLNHPTLESLRRSKSDAIIFVDDFIGSGGRVHEFLNGFWLEPTVVSWLSGKQIGFHIVAYSGTEEGVNYAERHKSKPHVHIYRDAPTFTSFAWGEQKKSGSKNYVENTGTELIKDVKICGVVIKKEWRQSFLSTAVQITHLQFYGSPISKTAVG